MSVIQQIQEKYAKLMAVIIAIALIIFVVMLAFENGGSLFRGSNATTVGKVNGEAIDVNSFQKKVTQIEDYMKNSQGYPAGAALNQQAIEQAWNSEVSQLVMNSELEKLGMQIGKREIGDILYGENPPQDLRQQFTDESGRYNAQLAKSQIDQMLKKGTAEQKAQFNAYLNNLEFGRMNEKYVSLFTNSVNTPKWMVEKQNADNSQISKIAFVRELYSSVPDSSVKVSDAEIQEYVNKHKEDFKQEESRSIAYVAFSALPSAADTAQTLKDVLEAKPELDSTTDAVGMINRLGSSLPYSEIYYPKSQLLKANQQMNLGFKDTILSLPKNGVYGPYLDGGSYVLAKLLDTKILPDSVKCRHILLGTVDRSGQPIMDDSIAHAKADSIAMAIRNGANFDTLETKYSTDQVAHKDKGVMTFSSTDIQNENFAKEFGDFILNDGKPGDKKVIKTSFGYHYIEILSAINPEMHYKIAYLGKKIEAGTDTENGANNEAAQFASNSRDQKAFDANADSLRAKGINKLIAANIPPTGYQIDGLGISRPFVKSIYEADLGEVLEPERVGDNWVVAIVTEINKKGTQSVAKARPVVERLLINHKKAETIAKKIGNITTLEAAAATLGGRNIEVVDSLRLTGSASPVLGQEPKIFGAAFNPANKGKVVPQAIEGAQGVYVLRVDNVSATSVIDANVAEQRKAMYQQGKMRAAYPQAALQEAADIKDYRSKIY